MNVVAEVDQEGMRRLRWQCRRGLLELDVLFLQFLDARYANLDSDMREKFEALLKQPDHSILAWLQGQEQSPKELQSIITILK